jgi:hypothetical protein
MLFPWLDLCLAARFCGISAKPKWLAGLVVSQTTAPITVVMRFSSVYVGGLSPILCQTVHKPSVLARRSDTTMSSASEKLQGQDAFRGFLRWTLWLLVVGPLSYFVASVVVSLAHGAVTPFWRQEMIISFALPIGLLHLLSALFKKHSVFIWSTALTLHGLALWYGWARLQPGNVFLLMIQGLVVTWPGILTSMIGGVLMARYLGLPLYPKTSKDGSKKA